MKSIVREVSKSPVVPIPPAYTSTGELDTSKIKDYVLFLEKQGVKTIMTTAGTSQFNLLSYDEYIAFQEAVMTAAKRINVIVGLQGANTKSTIEATRRLESLESFGNNCFFMALYPDRYYNDDNIVEYFSEVADVSVNPIFIHGMFMRRGFGGGNYDFSAELINKISSHKNIIGMKEETSSIEKAYDIVRKINKDDFVVIVAGGSMRRFLSLGSTRKNNTFLSGVGNFVPKIEQMFLDNFKDAGIYSKDKESIYLKRYEDALFDVFMRYGWHRCLRYGLDVLGVYSGSYERKPFSELNSEEKQHVKRIIIELVGASSQEKI